MKSSSLRTIYIFLFTIFNVVLMLATQNGLVHAMKTVVSRHHALHSILAAEPEEGGGHEAKEGGEEGGAEEGGAEEGGAEEGGEEGGSSVPFYIMISILIICVLIIVAVLFNEARLRICTLYQEHKRAHRTYTDSERFEMELRAAAHWKSDPKIYQPTV